MRDQWVFTSVDPKDVVAVLAGRVLDDDRRESAQRCLTALADTPNVWRLGSGIDTIRTLAKLKGIGEGALIVDIAKTYWAERDSYDGFVAIYRRLASISPQFQPVPYDTLADEFRNGRRKTEFEIAMIYLSDASVAISAWVEAYNRKGSRSHQRMINKLEKLH